MSLQPFENLSNLPLFRAVKLKTAIGGRSWGYDNLIGILSEISEQAPSGALSFLADVLYEAQSRRETVAWVAGMESVFYPPDLSERGIDLSALTVIRTGVQMESLTAAEWLIRSGAIGLVVVDVEGQWNINDAALGRIQKVAERNLCAVVFLTRKGAQDPSLGSRISLRGCITRSGAAPFVITINTIKDKRSNSRFRQSRQYYGPSGMYLR